MKTIIALILLMFTNAAVAQAIGQVHVTQGQAVLTMNGVSTAVRSMMLVQDGSTVLVPSNGRATVTLASGCVVKVSASEFLTLDSSLTCAQLQASVLQFTKPSVAVLGGMAATSVAAFITIKNDEKVSGS